MGDSEWEEARKLIGNAGFIRHKEQEGHFKFYSGEELRQLAEQAGFVQLHLATAFEGDIHLVSGVKS